MNKQVITSNMVSAFCLYLRNEERSEATIEKYARDISQFAAWLGRRQVTKGETVLWKEHLQSAGYAPGSINGKLTALDRFFDFSGWKECKVKHLKIQRRLFRDEGRELTCGEYKRLLAAARALGGDRLPLLLEAICGTGIRVSEVRYLTVEAAKAGRAEIALKGKIRMILIPGKLCRKLLKYARKHKVASGEIFLTRGGQGLGRKQIWHEMKKLCELAAVAPGKVFPHNLRHLFARTFYQTCRDVAKLADVLGHSSIETTRIYLISTGTEHARTLDMLGLVS